jgi:hypothetical protein
LNENSVNVVIHPEHLAGGLNFISACAGGRGLDLGLEGTAQIHDVALEIRRLVTAPAQNGSLCGFRRLP